MAKFYTVFFIIVITIPLFLGINAWQANECGKLRNEIYDMEKFQENCVEENKTVVGEIADLLAIDRLENEAQKRLGLHKVRPGDVTLIIMGGKGLDL